MRVDLLPENEASGLSSQTSFRLEIDASSNPSPLGGLQINAPSTTQFNIPLLSNNGSGFGLCEAYVDDPAGDFDLSQISSGIVKFNHSGYFELGFNVFIISQVNETNGTIVTILKNGQAIFGSHPATAFSRDNGDSYTQLPGYFVKNFPATANVKIQAGDEVVLAMIANNTTPGNDISIQACTNMFCTRISNIGILGSSSVVGGDTNLENIGTGNTILVNNGIYPSSVQRNFKTLIAGTDISFTDSGSDITIDYTGSGGTPNSDLTNLGAGEPILATTGVLPVTNTRNFKTLVAGSNITLTPTANDITIASTGGTNIYNTDGTLTGARTVNMNGATLTFTGIGTVFLRSWSGTRIGDTAPSSDIVIGRTGVPTWLQSNKLTVSNLPVYNANTFVTFNTVSKLLGYTTYTPPDNAIFSVGMDAFTQAGPFAASYQLPSGFLLAYSTAFPTNHPGYNNAGVTLDLITGVYSPSQTNEYEILVKITLKNDTEIPNFLLTVYNATSATTISSCTCNGGEINKYNSWSLIDRLTLNAANNYAVYLTFNNGAGTTYDVSDLIYSVNLV